MTHPEASPDGTGTQTDEVRAALDRLHMLAKIEQLADRESVTADILSEAASVLSAEIERLTRRVEECEASNERDRSLLAVGITALKKTMVGYGWLSEAGRGSYAYDDEGYQREFGAALVAIKGNISGLEQIARDWTNCPKDATVIKGIRTALASAAAPDERVLAERELAQAAFKFVAWAMREGPWGPSDLDGGDVQDKAQALGLIVETQYDPDKHGENHEDAEPGDQWFVLAPPILDAIRARTPDQDTAP